MLRKRGRSGTEVFQLTPGTFVWAQLKANDWWAGKYSSFELRGIRCSTISTERMYSFVGLFPKLLIMHCF